MEINIPDMPRERVLELAEKIVPLVRSDSLVWSEPKGLCYVPKMDPFRSFCAARPVAEARDLVPITDIVTYFKYEQPSLCFTPTAAKLIPQIPEQYLDTVVAFEIVQWPCDFDYFRQHEDAYRLGYHHAVTRLFARR